MTQTKQPPGSPGRFTDYFRIDLVNFITNLGPQTALDFCYTAPRPGGPNGSRSAACQYVHRGPDKSIQFLDSLSFNFARLLTSGFDVAFDYVLPIGNLIPFMSDKGTFKFVLDSQYLTKYDQFTPNADGSVTRSGFAGITAGATVLPRFKANTALTWRYESVAASWSTRFIRTTTESCNDGRRPSLSSLGLCSDPKFDKDDKGKLIDVSENKLPDILYHDVQVNYTVPGADLTLTAGINNVLDKRPPISFSQFANSIPPTLYGPISREGYVRFKINF